MPSSKAIAAAKSKEEEGPNALTGASIQLLQETASDIVEKVSSVSTLFDDEKDKQFSKFDWTGEFVYQPILIYVIFLSWNTST